MFPALNPQPVSRYVFHGAARLGTAEVAQLCKSWKTVASGGWLGSLMLLRQTLLGVGSRKSCHSSDTNKLSETANDDG